MRELSLFTGAGGGLLASKLLGWRTVGYVEFNEYCQRAIRARQDDGMLDRAPIFGDIRAFISEGFADGYQGMVDVVSGGFPCQPFSAAGKQRADADERNMWPATIDVIRRVRPRYAFLENVPGLCNKGHGYIRRVIGDLTEAGYDCRWRVLSAAELGAPHKRDRLWIVARDANCHSGSTGSQHAEACGVSEDVADSCGARTTAWVPEPQQRKKGDAEVSDHRSDRRPRREAEGYWATEPDVGRVVDGVASRVDRLKALGNGQVPQVATAAWRLLTEGWA